MNAYYDARIKGRTTDRGMREKGSLKSNKIKLGWARRAFFLVKIEGFERVGFRGIGCFLISYKNIIIMM